MGAGNTPPGGHNTTESNRAFRTFLLNEAFRAAEQHGDMKPLHSILTAGWSPDQSRRLAKFLKAETLAGLDAARATRQTSGQKP